MRVGRGAGIGRDAGQDSLAQPAPAGRRGHGGDGCGTQTVLTRRPRRGGEGYVSTRCPQRGTQTVTPRRPLCGEGSAHDPAPSARHSDSADPAPPPYWRGVRQHPVPLWRHSGGHAPPRAARREVCHDPVPSAGWLRHHGWPARWCRCVPAGRCPVLQEGLASANPRQGDISTGGGGKTTAWRAGLIPLSSPPGPLSTMWRGGV